MAEQEKCRSCGAPIRWVRTTQNKLIPLDAEPSPDGNIEILNGKAVVHPQSPMAPGALYITHFVTCPQADEWRAKP